MDPVEFFEVFCKQRYPDIEVLEKGKLIELKRVKARPAGSAFLGSKAASVRASLGTQSGPSTRIIIDSGSDISLISDSVLKTINPPLKQITGRRLSIIHVTGKATIQGYVKMPLFFDTNDGPVKLVIEAYIVKGMTAPFILGNDFADQYELSLIRHKGETHLIFGRSMRRMLVTDSTGAQTLNGQGEVFSVTLDDNLASKWFKLRQHKRIQKSKRVKTRRLENYVRSLERVIVPPYSVKKVIVDPSIFDKYPTVYSERLFNTNSDPYDIYAAPDSIITRNTPFLHISNFSTRPVTISKGQPIAKLKDPYDFLDDSAISLSTQAKYERHAYVIRAIVKDISFSSAHENFPHVPGDEPIEGGPKTAESPAESPASSSLLSEIHISPELDSSQRQEIEAIISRNRHAFGLDGRLGHYPAKVKIRLKEGAEPISLPPFPQSPAKREVMDKQMDNWIQLEVIEPSVSPWAAPAFITYRDGKPRMVIDYRKLNEQVVADEFPLPKQEDILQAITGSCWLSTLDALSGFTQLEMSDDSKEYTGFRSHRGLYHFKRLPFGYRNGPSVFQRIMQDILSPFLWIFALVYIDDIVIYSKTFDDHLKHLSRVLGAIGDSGITLSPKKCHFAYQSLKLLGQKVSRLGLSTHKSKVDAIIQLKEPRNVKELQTFLGMMVYFSAYIPYYAWIVAPLFKLLKKGAEWKWNALEQEAFDLSKEVLTNAPVRAFAIPGLGYRLYTDACDYGLGAILQQVQPIAIRDLKGTKTYEKLKDVHSRGLPIPQLVVDIDKSNDGHNKREWSVIFEDTIVDVERVIAYWSRTLKPAERNYSPTEREALALKEGLIKFQAYLEGESVCAVTDHAALTWSRTFQNLNRRLLTWGTVFSAYPGLRIIHRAGRVHSNVDPISRLRRRIPFDSGPKEDITISKEINDPLKNVYAEFGDRFERKVLNLAVAYQSSLEETTQDKQELTFSYNILTRGQVQKKGRKEMFDGPTVTDSAKQAPISPYSSNLSSPTTLTGVPNRLETPEDKKTIKLSYKNSIRKNLNTHMTKDELNEWLQAYSEDSGSVKIIEDLRLETDHLNPRRSRYYLDDKGLLFFEDAQGNLRLYVPTKLISVILKEDHETLTVGAHSGTSRSFYRMAHLYYWPRMYQDIKEYIRTCDICQKVKHRRHAPYGHLQSLPIPGKPFDVVSIDFIPELPKTESNHDNIIVIVDKLTKFATFIPCTVQVGAKETAELLFKHVFTRFGFPREIVSDRDSKWVSSFWRRACELMEIKRALSTSHHPQTDGQTEIMNQVLEVALRCYVNERRDNWDTYLDGFSLAYNSTPHSATQYAPSFLLYGYTPRNGSRSRVEIDNEDAVDRRRVAQGGNQMSLDSEADHFISEFEGHRLRAKDHLAQAQASQQLSYNSKHKLIEFEVGDQVLINLKTLRIQDLKESLGKKLRQRFEGPFEVTERVSQLAYRLRLPSSYTIHNVINVCHLEPYHESPKKFGQRLRKGVERLATAEQEWEVDRILEERVRATRRGRKRKEYLIRYAGYSSDHDEWVPIQFLRNAPEITKAWKQSRKVHVH